MCIRDRTHAVRPARLAREKDVEQMNLCLGFPGVQTGDERSYEFSVVNSVLGGSMSSRLFQKIREESGLAYSIYSYPNSYTDCGLTTISVSYTHLLLMVGQRRGLLDYLKSTDIEAYRALIAKLGLRK